MPVLTAQEMQDLANTNLQQAQVNLQTEQLRANTELQRAREEREHQIVVIDRNNRLNAINNAKDILININRSRPADEQTLSEEAILSLAGNLLSFVNQT